MTRSEIYGVAKDALHRSSEDHLTFVAAGVAFFVLLAIFPGIAAIISLFGLVADPQDGGALLSALSSVLPEQAVGIIQSQIEHSADKTREGRAMSFLPVVGLVILLWSTNKGMLAIFNALNIIHNVDERRGFVRLNAMSLLFTIGLIALLLFFMSVVFVFPAAAEQLGIDQIPAAIVTSLRWLALLVVVGFAIALLYRYGSSRDGAMRWISAGSAVAALLWIVVSLLFEWTVSNFGGFAQLYGSLSSVIGFMVWIWLSSIVVLFGAELDMALSRHAGDAE
jgi:membrane protein